MDKYFLVQIKRTNGTIEKGVVVKDSLDDGKQGFHAYMSAYAYGHDKDKDGNIKTDYVQAQVLDGNGTGWIGEVWELPTVPPEPEPPEPEEA
jgi:hypothetical protein